MMTEICLDLPISVNGRMPPDGRECKQTPAPESQRSPRASQLPRNSLFYGVIFKA